LYQYRVDFSPEEDIISNKRGLLAQHRKYLGGYLFDGTMLFSGTRFDPAVSCRIKLKLIQCFYFILMVIVVMVFDNKILRIIMPGIA